VRGDALAKYNTRNQSEPLRINLWGLAMVVAAIGPTLLQELYETPTPLTTTLGCAVATLGSAALFVQNCQRRNQQLVRLEKELQALSLTVKLPRKQSSSSSLLDGSSNGVASLYNNVPVQSIRQAQASSTLRILAVTSSNLTQLQTALQQLQGLAPRLIQSNTVVVPILSLGNGNPKDPMSLSQLVQACQLSPSVLQTWPWLAAPGQIEAWQAYWNVLGSNNNNNPDATFPNDFKWFGLSATGRSFGSGTDLPSWLQLMGQHLRPTVLLEDETERPLVLGTKSDETAIAQDDKTAILQELQTFYTALTTGDLTTMQTNVFLGTSDLVTQVTQQGGRLEDWAICLQEGNRPAGMQIADAQVVLVGASSSSDNDNDNDYPIIAYSSVLEYPSVDTIAAAVDTPTLLAVQSWTQNRQDNSWKLVQHQTIPWSDLAPAQGTLVCDARGCVSLVRTS